mmetsp:Transcript_6420/g.9862  ORF Transcript_6420/g.9862 Transcript_6420/m.9862 type:complete len:266 (+) Transcript_6420:484-1281(+)
MSHHIKYRHLVNHSDRNAFPMVKQFFLLKSFHCMSDSMPKIKSTSQTFFSFILSYHVRLTAYSAKYNLCKGLRVLFLNLFRIFFHIFKEVNLSNTTHLYSLREPFSHLFGSKRRQEVHISVNNPRLMKRSDKVFAKWNVNSSLSPNTAIHHSHNGGRNLNHWYPSEIRSCDKSGQISHHSSSKCYNTCIAETTHSKHIVFDLRLDLATFGFFPWINLVRYGIKALFFAVLQKLIAVEGVDCFVTNDDKFRCFRESGFQILCNLFV